MDFNEGLRDVYIKDESPKNFSFAMEVMKMRNLLHANFVRYIRRPVTLLAFLVSLTMSIISVVHSMRQELHDGQLYEYFKPDLGLSVFVMFLAVIVTAINLGSEFSSASIRNKLIAGYSKSVVFISELILAILFSTILYLLFYGPFLVIRWKYLSRLDFLFGASALLLCCILSVTVIMVFLCFILENRIVAAIIGMMLIVVMIVMRDELYSRLTRPEYYTEYVYEDGHTATMRADPDSMKKPDDVIKVNRIPNSRYIGGIRRVILTVIYEASAYDALVEFNQYIGSSQISVAKLPEEVAKTQNKYIEEKVSTLKRETAYNAGIMVVFSCLGVLIFRKKNIK